MALLEVEDLHVSFNTADGVVRAVRGLTFSVDRGKTVGIVGESGSGKSVSTQTIMGLTAGARVSGQARFEGADLLTMGDKELREVRGAKVGMIFQDPLSSLHPYYRVGWQIVEMIRAHEQVSKAAAKNRAIDLLRLVGIPKPEVRVDEFPHQFSGGMRQRAMIAMAMALNPILLIADEPTTALDVTVQAQVLEVMGRLQAEFGTAIVMITHDLGVIADFADDVVVMYAGTAMEQAERRELFYHNHHPYTEGLLASVPQPGADRTKRLLPIHGTPPSLIQLPTGCPFHPRCPYAFDKCRTETPPLESVFGRADHQSACWLSSIEEERAAARSAVQAELASQTEIGLAAAAADAADLAPAGLA